MRLRSPDDAAADGRAVSPAVGVVLLVAIVVLLAAASAGALLRLGDTLDAPAPQASFSFEYHADGAGNGDNGAYLVVTHEAGDIGDGSNVYVVDGDGDAIAWEDVWLGDETVSAGGRAHIDGKGMDETLDPICEAGQTYRVVYRGDGSDAVLEEFTVPTEPTSAAVGEC